MRQRKLKWADDYLIKCERFIKYKTSFELKENTELEIGCGKGNFLISKALNNPNINYLGIDLTNSILAIACKKADEQNVPNNLDFSLVNALKLTEIISNKVNNIYLNFSDPWPKKRHANRRLTSPLFLKQYHEILKENGRIFFRTDNVGLYEYSLEVLENNELFKIEYASNDTGIPSDGIISEYECKFRSLGNKICAITLRRI